MNLKLKDVKKAELPAYIENVLIEYFYEIEVPVRKITVTGKKEKLAIKTEFRVFAVDCELPLTKQFLNFEMSSVVLGISEAILLYAKQKGVDFK